MNEYHEQAEKFLNDFGIKFRATLADSKPAPWEGASGHHYRITLVKPNKLTYQQHRAFDVLRDGKVVDTVFYSAGSNVTADEVLKSLRDHDGVDCDAVRACRAKHGQRLAFDFWGSRADREAGRRKVHPYDVLACISGDVNCPETFGDFCAEYGYKVDSIKALQTFNRCRRFAARLRAFFTQAEIDRLVEID